MRNITKITEVCFDAKGQSEESFSFLFEAEEERNNRVVERGIIKVRQSDKSEFEE